MRDDFQAQNHTGKMALVDKNNFDTYSMGGMPFASPVL